MFSPEECSSPAGQTKSEGIANPDNLKPLQGNGKQGLQSGLKEPGCSPSGVEKQSENGGSNRGTACAGEEPSPQPVEGKASTGSMFDNLTPSDLARLYNHDRFEAPPKPVDRTASTVCTSGAENQAGVGGKEPTGSTASAANQALTYEECAKFSTAYLMQKAKECEGNHKQFLASFRGVLNRFKTAVLLTDGKVQQSKHVQGDVDDLIKIFEDFVSKVQAAIDSSKHAKHIVDAEIQKLFKKLDTLIIVTDEQSRADEIAGWLIFPLHECMLAHIKNEGIKPSDLEWVSCSGLSPENKCSGLTFPFNLIFITQDKFTADKYDPKSSVVFLHSQLVKEASKKTFADNSTGENFGCIAAQGLPHLPTDEDKIDSTTGKPVVDPKTGEPVKVRTNADFNLIGSSDSFCERLHLEGGVFPGWDTNHPVRLIFLEMCYSPTGRFRAFNPVWVMICKEASIQSAGKVFIINGLFIKNADGTYSFQVFTWGALCLKTLTDPADPTKTLFLANNARALIVIMVGLRIIPETFLDRIKPAYYTPGDMEKLFIDIQWEVINWLERKYKGTIDFSFLESTKFTESLASFPADKIAGMTTLTRRGIMTMLFKWIIVASTVKNGGVPVYTKENTEFSGTLTEGVDMFPIFDGVSGKALLGALFFCVDFASLTNSIYGGMPTKESFTPLAYEMFPAMTPAEMAANINEFLIRCGNCCSDLVVRLNIAVRFGRIDDERDVRAEAADFFKVMLRRFKAIDSDCPPVLYTAPDPSGVSPTSMPGDGNEASGKSDPTRVTPTPTPGGGNDPPDDPLGLAHPKLGNELEKPGESELTQPNSAAAQTPSHAGEGADE